MACHEFHHYRNIFPDWMDMVKPPEEAVLSWQPADFEEAEDAGFVRFRFRSHDFN